MTTLEVIILVVWVIGSLWHVRFVAREILKDFGRPDWFDVTAMGGVGVFTSWLWPCTLLFSLLQPLAFRFAKAHSAEEFAAVMFGEARNAKLKRRENEVSERERRIAQLEREVGI